MNGLKLTRGVFVGLLDPSSSSMPQHHAGTYHDVPRIDVRSRGTSMVARLEP